MAFIYDRDIYVNAVFNVNIQTVFRHYREKPNLTVRLKHCASFLLHCLFTIVFTFAMINTSYSR